VASNDVKFWDVARLPLQYSMIEVQESVPNSYVTLVVSAHRSSRVNSTLLAGTRPQPDYSVRFKRNAFTKDTSSTSCRPSLATSSPGTSPSSWKHTTCTSPS
jgi:hypothetical protein